MSALPPHGERALSLIEEALSRASRERVRFWWRDDDASAGSDALTRLLTLSDECGAPVALAVVPGQLKSSLTAGLRGRNADVLVHGWRHKNHAAAGEPKSEYPAARSREDVHREFAESLQVVREAFPEQAMAVFVPPWNRLTPGLEDTLIECGYVGLSSARAMRMQAPARGKLRRADADLNLVRTGGESRLADLESAIASLAKQIENGNRGPFGVITHHRQHDDDVWAFCRAFWQTIEKSSRAEAISAHSIFYPQMAGASGPER